MCVARRDRNAVLFGNANHGSAIRHLADDILTDNHAITDVIRDLLAMRLGL